MKFNLCFLNKNYKQKQTKQNPACPPVTRHLSVMQTGCFSSHLNESYSFLSSDFDHASHSGRERINDGVGRLFPVSQHFSFFKYATLPAVTTKEFSSKSLCEAWKGFRILVQNLIFLN